MPAAAFIILHLSDTHFTGSTTDVETLLDSIAQARTQDVREGASRRAPSLASIDLIAVTGDICHKEDAYATAERFLSGLADLYHLSRDRVLVVPGNHDVTYHEDGVAWDAFAEFWERWYGELDNAWRVYCPAGARGEQVLTGYVVDQRDDLGVVCYLMNSLSGIACGSASLTDVMEGLWPGERGGAAVLTAPSTTRRRRARGWRESDRVGVRRDKLKNLGVVGEAQLAAMAAVCDEHGIDGSVSSVALIHHHLFPVRTGEIKQSDMARQSVLLDFPDVLDWLARRSCKAVFHGHRHVPGFTRLRSEGLPAGLTSQALPKQVPPWLEHLYSSTHALDLVVMGVGPVAQEAWGGVDGGVRQIQVVRVMPHAIRRYDEPVEAVPYVMAGLDWKCKVDGKPWVISAHEAVTGLEHEIHDAEYFFTHELSAAWRDPRVIHRVRPLEIGQVDFARRWFWDHYATARALGGPRADELFYGDPTAPYQLGGDDERRRQSGRRSDESGHGSDDVGGVVERDRQGEVREGADGASGPPALTYRQAVVANLIRLLNEHNRRYAIFGILPAQLYGLYALGALLFNEREVHEMAALEFHRPEWKQLLKEDVENLAGVWRNHLEDANWFIAKEVARWWKVRAPAGEVVRDANVNVVEFGFGALRTLKWVTLQLAAEGASRMSYLGIDINEPLVMEASSLLARREGLQLAVTPIAQVGEYLVNKAISGWLQSLESTKLNGEIDVLLASYCLHHCVGTSVLRQALMDGTFFAIFDGDSIGSGGKKAELFYDAVCKGYLFGDVDGEQKRRELAERMCALMSLYRGLKHDPDGSRVSETGRVNVARARGYVESVEAIMREVPDRQEMIFRRIGELVRPGGLVAIADPNGYSRTFNRQQIIHDWPLVLSHFSDWPMVVRRLATSGFEILCVQRQIRKQDLSVGMVPVPEDAVATAATGEVTVEDDDTRHLVFHQEEPHPLEIEDEHLGYVIVARRLPG